MSEQMKKTAKPITSVLPGFLELLPADQLVFDYLKGVIEESYRRFGFLPLDTPAIERAEVLLAKAGGETEKQIYRFNKGENDLALRFDLTVPLARYVSEHLNDLDFPFRRYQIAKVYRGERPQKGRYREFYQCDIDVIGRNHLSLAVDAELLALIYDIFSRLGLPSFQIRINNRQLFSGLLESLSLNSLSSDVLRVVDKIDKVGREETEKSLADLGINGKSLSLLLDFISQRGPAAVVFPFLESLKIENELFARGLNELKSLVSYLSDFSVPLENYVLDMSIARGLDYYTGTVCETFLLDYPQFGSICSGGRYNDLAGDFAGEALPGVGVSIGLTRLFTQLKDNGLLPEISRSNIEVLFLPFDEAALPAAIFACQSIRKAGLAAEAYLEEVKFKNKLNYANKRGVKWVVIIGENEIKGSFYTLKDMESGEQQELKLDDLLEYLKKK